MFRQINICQAIIHGSYDGQWKDPFVITIIKREQRALSPNTPEVTKEFFKGLISL